jgi:hypothetical protein
MNSKVVKSGMEMLTVRENADVVDADVFMGWKLQPAAGTVVSERERESWCGVSESQIQTANH